MSERSEARHLNRVIQITLKTAGPDTQAVRGNIDSLIKVAIAGSISSGAIKDLIKPAETISKVSMDLATGEEITQGVMIPASIVFPPAALINLAFGAMMLASVVSGGKI